MASGLKFIKLSLHDWRQFDSVILDVHPRLTVITGTNGAGKSTILNIFTQHFGFNRPFLSVPRRMKDGALYYDIGLRQPGEDDAEQNDEANRDPDAFERDPAPPRAFSGQFVEFGTVQYSNNTSSSIGIHEQNTQSYGLQLNNQQQVLGVHIGSHRALTNYQPVNNISLQPMRVAQAYNLFNQEIMNRYGGGHTGYSPIYRMKEALIGMAAFGEGNSVLQADSEVLKTFRGFIEVLRNVMPEEIGFRSLAIRIPDVVLQTRSGDFILDSSSGGVNAIIEMAWQIYLYSEFIKTQGTEDFVVTMDEPENHLHPSMQRAIIPSLLAAFPSAQFIVATHSPFVVSAVEDSSVYVLNYTGRGPSGTDVDALPEKRRVTSVKLDNVHKGGTASEILREVLGVPVTTPKWAQEKVDEILTAYLGKTISTDLLNSLRADMSREGFGELYPDALSRLVSASENGA
jgi:hypothetical protein